MEAASGRRASRCSRWRTTGRPRVRYPRLQPVGRAHLHERPQPDRPGRRAVHAADRGADPLIVAGGHCTFNPEPLADFVDAFVLGDGEEAVGDVTDVLAPWLACTRSSDRDRRDVLLVAPGRRSTGSTSRALYAPSATTSWAGSSPPSPVVSRRPRAGSRKRTIARPRRLAVPQAAELPFTEVVHDRLNVEVFRGCTPRLPVLPGRDDHSARSASARPPRSARWSSDGLERTGYDEVALTSLSTADFSDIEDTVRYIVDDPRPRRAGVRQPARACGSTPSPSARRREIQKVRRTGLTFAPEGGTWRMRTVINKLITEEDLYGAVDAAFSQGWRRRQRRDPDLQCRRRADAGLHSRRSGEHDHAGRHFRSPGTDRARHGVELRIRHADCAGVRSAGLQGLARDRGHLRADQRPQGREPRSRRWCPSRRCATRRTPSSGIC